MNVPLQRQTGFTIVEISIFLAVSGLLLAVAFIGTNGSIGITRFRDSINSVQAYMQGQYSDILNGVNPRDGSQACASATRQVNPGSQPAGQSNCLILGKLVQFTLNSDTLNTYYVVGAIPSTPPPVGASDEAILESYQPRAVQNVDNETYQVPWQAIVTGSKDSNGKAPDSYLLLRSPTSGQIYSYIFYVGGGFPPAGDLSTTVRVANRGTTNVSANICLKSIDGVGGLAMVSVAAGGGQSGITSAFDVDSNSCNGVSP